MGPRGMVRDVRSDAAAGIVVLGWRSAEDGLFLKARGQDEDIRIVCHCGRCHWIIREQFSLGQVLLALTCHNCGQRASFVMEGVSLPAP